MIGFSKSYIIQNTCFIRPFKLDQKRYGRILFIAYISLLISIIFAGIGVYGMHFNYSNATLAIYIGDDVMFVSHADGM